jgi:putative polyketide hydroxylase
MTPETHRFPVDPVADETAPVLIVGGGVTGLATALFLAWHGVRPLLVERHPDLLSHPRARGFTPRTVELFRQVGLEQAIADATFAAGDLYQWRPVQAETLAGEYTPVEDPDEGEPLARVSPSQFAPIDQDKLEALIRRRAEELGADLRFSTELTAIEHDDAGVTATLANRHSGEERVVRAKYLVAADGASSPLRQQLGIDVDGPGPFFQVLSIMIDADLRPALRGRQVSIAYLEKPRPGTFLLAHDDAGLRWVFGTGYAPEHGESLADFSDERCVALVREAAGLPAVEVTLRPQIPGTDIKQLGFPIGAQVARQYRAGPVFLVGDAAHMVPPTGGLGANTGIQDAHNLAWKLAAVLHGEADPALLDTYQDERRPVGVLTMQQALARWGARVGAGTEGEQAPLLDYTAIAFGYRYRSPAVIGGVADGAPALLPSQLRGQPGTRAPHVWLTRGGERLSTLDLFGRQFVLLAGSDGQEWVDAARRLSGERGVDLAAYRIGPGGDLTDIEGEFVTAYELAPAGTVFVRPDGFVAWRTPAEADPAAALEDALLHALGRASALARVG